MVSAFVIMAFFQGTPVRAQLLDSDLLKQFENLKSSDRRTSTRSPINESREQGTGFTQMDGLTQEQMQRLRGEEDFSALELDYQRRASALLRQFGYELFAGSGSNRAEAVTGRVSDSYVLGVGDEVVVTFHGSTSGSQIVPVDREGRILIEDLPPVEAAGRRFAEVRDEIRERTGSALIGTEAFVSVGALKMISVYVVGEVESPGLHRLTGLASVFDALNWAGGVKKTGSLRRIRLHSGSKVEKVDLYELFAGGEAGDLTLQDGDRIVVPTIGPTAAVSGSAVRPGIYEIFQNTSLDGLVKLAGGSLRPKGFELAVRRISDDGRDMVEQVEKLSVPAQGGDIVQVYNGGGGIGGVELAGHVRAPGMRPLAKGTMLSDVLTGTEMLEDAPYLLFGIIETTDPRSQARLFKAFSPMKVLFGDADYQLHEKDRVIFFDREDIDFLSSNETRSVVLTGEYKPEVPSGDDLRMSVSEPKICKPLKELARIVRDTRSERFAAAIRAVFVQVDASSDRTDEEMERRAIERIQSSDTALMMQGNVANMQAMSGQRPMDIGQDQDQWERKRKEDELAHLREEDDSDCPKVYGLAPNLLPFVLEYVTSADGAVRAPGVYPVVNDTPVSALAAVAGGTTNIVDLTNVELLSLKIHAQEGEINFERHYVDATVTDLSRVSINPGSSVRFNAIFIEQESGGVLLEGEFRRPGVYTIRRGEKLSELIERAGGLTRQAYPYGAVFTRERVKRAQQEGFKRAERELNMGLATAALKQRELSADTLIGAQQLSKSISTLEAVGRVVIEADPRVLEARPNLDTVLEPGDEIFIPKRPNYVLMLGDVLNPGAVQFMPGKDVKDYLGEAGGIQKTADKSRLFVVLPNGEARPVRTSSWGGSSNVMIPPGTSIIVPKDMEPVDTLMLVRDLTAIFSQLAVSAASIAVISR